MSVALHHRFTLAAALALSALAALWIAPAQADDPSCKPSIAETATVKSAIDGRTLLLSDGREVRLAGIEATEQAKTALEALVSGREVALLGTRPETDRYGRVVALVALQPAAPGRSVQQMLLELGQARVSAHVGEPGCAAALLNAEKAARTAGLGLWGDPYYVMRKAEDPAGILAVRGRFAVVEGTILSVRESGGTIYVNFGRRWSDDFTVTVLKRNERIFTAAGLPLKKLAGQHVRVRGIVEERGGPWIEAARPEQIEIAERGHE